MKGERRQTIARGTLCSSRNQCRRTTSDAKARGIGGAYPHEGGSSASSLHLYTIAADLKYLNRDFLKCATLPLIVFFGSETQTPSTKIKV